jgi:hypothetical protein
MPLHAFRRAVVTTLLEDAATPRSDTVDEDVQAFVAHGIAAMPPHLRLGVLGVEALLVAETLARTRTAFPRLGPTERLARIRAWETSALAPANQFVRLIRSLVLFAAHERTPA